MCQIVASGFFRTDGFQRKGNNLLKSGRQMMFAESVTMVTGTEITLLLMEVEGVPRASF